MAYFKMTKLSIIVPIYGVEQYLRKCVDSLLKQDYDDYEIILVDDESPDACPQICDDYAAKHDNIRVIHRKNGGLSAARNTGIQAAHGQYIMFVDSDDYIEPNVLRTLMSQVEREQLDALRFDYQNVRRNSAGEYAVFQPYKAPHQVDTRHDVADGETYLDERMGYACYACQFVINRELTGMFTPGIHFEDTEWLPRMMLAAKRVNSTPLMVYNYFWREGSITLTQGDKTKIKKNVEDCMTVIKQYKTYREQFPGCKWLRNMQSTMAVSVIASVAQSLYAERRDFLSRLKDLDVFPLATDIPNKTYLRKARLINFSPRLAMTLLHHKNGK